MGRHGIPKNVAKQLYPGNTLMSQAAFDEHVMRVGRSWLDMARLLEQEAARGLVVDRVTIKGLWAPGNQGLIILTALEQQAPVVAFHNVDDLAMVWVGLGNRLRNGSLRWREDEYRKQE